ncbi:hypothetical protein CHU98_g6272 [Xylaria longipes]|nr:hypothetical protein CHU98_g6272 [Xylaria longipes]
MRFVPKSDFCIRGGKLAELLQHRYPFARITLCPDPRAWDWNCIDTTFTWRGMTRNLVCVGACYLDTIFSVPHYPAEDSKLRASSLQVRRGGNCPNTLEVLQQFLREEQGDHESVKIRPSLVTCLPSRNAPATVQIIESFGVDSPVDFSRCIFRDRNEQPASSYIIRSSATGSRTLVNYNDLAEMSFHEFVAAAESVGGEDAWFHFEWLRRSKPKARVSVEVEKPGREGLEKLVAEADVIFFSRSWAEVRSAPRSFEQPIGSIMTELYRVTHTPVPRNAFSPNRRKPGGGPISSVRGVHKERPVRRLMEPSHLARRRNRARRFVSLSDTFIAGILFGFLQHDYDWDNRTKLSFAVQLATCKVQQEGFKDLGFKARSADD